MGKTDMKKKRIAIFLAILGLLLFGPIRSPISSAEGPKRVAIVPFTMNAERDLTFLQEGIMDMLASRLAWKGEVEVLEKGRVKKQAAQLEGPMDRANALETGRALKADYVIFGSLTVFGESVSIDARILDVEGGEELMTAFKQTKGMDEVIPTVNSFAMDINEKIMGRSIKPPVAAQAAGPAAEAVQGPGGLAAMGQEFEAKGVGEIQRFKVQIVGLDAGDVDGDGKNELVFVDKTNVYVYRWKEKGFALFKRFEGGMSAEYIYVNVADLDGNGKAEIYVSNLTITTVSSLVLEWDGNTLKKTADGQRWLLRVIDIPGKGKTLIGQRRAAGGGYSGKVQFMRQEGNKLVSTGPVDLPRFANVFNFAIVDLEGSGRHSTVLLDSSDYLRIYNPGKERIWRSDEYYGGSLTFMETQMEQNYIFIPAPIYLTDVDEDGQREVMISVNRAVTGRWQKRFRHYASGHVRFLTWDQVGLSPKWTTRKQGGPIVGYGVADVDHDGLQELVVASVNKQDRLLATPSSQVVVYDLK